MAGEQRQRGVEHGSTRVSRLRLRWAPQTLPRNRGEPFGHNDNCKRSFTYFQSHLGHKRDCQANRGDQAPAATPVTHGDGEDCRACVDEVSRGRERGRSSWRRAKTRVQATYGPLVDVSDAAAVSLAGPTAPEGS